MRAFRPLALATAAFLVLTGAAPNAAAAPLAAASRADSTSPPPVSWHFEPAQPCANQPVALVVMGFRATPCDSFLNAVNASGRIVIRTQVYEQRMCLLPPTEFFPVPLPLGRFQAGHHQFEIDHVVRLISPSGAQDSVTLVSYATLEVARCDSTPPPIGSLPYMREPRTEPLAPCADKPTSLVLSGVFPDACGRVIQASKVDPHHFILNLDPQAERVCPTVLTPFSVIFEPSTYPAGPQRIELQLGIVKRDSTEGTHLDIQRGIFDFNVAARCESLPFELPYVDHISIRPAIPQPGPGALICPSDSILVLIEGLFPTDCFRVDSVYTETSPIVGPGPEPPVVVIAVNNGCCLERACIEGPVFFKSAVTLPPLPPRAYGLIVRLIERCCRDTMPGPFPTAVVPFAVVSEESCSHGPPPFSCLIPRWDHSHRFGFCDAGIGPGHPAQVNFELHSGIALSGLQGVFHLDGPGLVITQIEPIGPASGMKLTWTPAPDGARFVMFAERGAPIPALDVVPILRVTVAMLFSTPSTRQGRLTAHDLLGADIAGNGVPECVSRLSFQPEDAATICVENACDFNSDGTSDVRDLVLMVHCVTGQVDCANADSAGTRFDCDQDGGFDLDDVLCCAARILRQGLCPDCPVDTSRVEPGVRVSFGTPVSGSGGIDLPVHIAGADRIGAARLAVRFPDDRFDFVSTRLAGDAAEWLDLHDVADGQALVALIRVPGLLSTAVVSKLDLVLHFVLRPGAEPAGEARVIGGEFSGPDGVKLVVDLGQPAIRFGTPGRIALSENWPEPFSGETRFSVVLESRAEVDVGVFDITGRLVARLHHGPLEAGETVLRWAGHRADGSQAPNGIYFYRVTSRAGTLSRRMVLIRGE